MKTVLPIEYKQSQIYCFDCKKVVRDQGYYIPDLKKAFCSKHYQDAVNKYFKS